MKRIYEQSKTVRQILLNQEVKRNIKYRKFLYLTEYPVESGSLFLNTITYELIFLNNEEIALLNTPDLDNSIARYLAERYFLVPEDFDDISFGTQVINTRIQIQNIYSTPPLSFFVILFEL